MVRKTLKLGPLQFSYLELKYAQNAGLRYAALLNRAGKRVWPTVKSVQEAERNTPRVPGGTMAKRSIVNAPGNGSCPICGFTYLLVYDDLRYLDNPPKAQALVRFLEWALTAGQLTAPDLHYTPLPASLQSRALALVKKIRFERAAAPQ
jgi:phosphate transport system substrate-binding protein